MAETGIITKARRVNLCRATSGAEPGIAKITHIAFGDSGVDDYGNPIPPVETQTALRHEIARYAVGEVTYPSDTTARYVVTIAANELIGAKISEAGLFDQNGVLCAVRTMFVKQKDEGVIFTFSFDDEF